MSEDDNILASLKAFSARATQALFAARLKAGQRGADMIGVGDLLLGLIVEDQGTIGSLLSDMGEPREFAKPAHIAFFSPETSGVLAAKIEAQLPRAAPISLTQEVPLSPDLKGTFDRAKDLQKMFDREQIEPLHLLLAILAEESSQYSQLLRVAGIATEQVVKKLKTPKIDEQMKRVSAELARAISEALVESRGVADVASRARADGLGIALRLDGTITLRRLASQEKTLPGRVILESLQLKLDVDESTEA